MMYGVMPRKCELTGKRVLYGCNVSHANNKLPRRFLPNLQRISFWSEALGSSLSFRITPSGVRTVEAKGGIDSYLLGIDDSKLSKRSLKIKRVLQSKVREGEHV
jgi:large subunit ribosomal protein L28